MSRIVEIYKFLKNEDKTRAALNNYLIEQANYSYAYASNTVSHLVATDVLLKHKGYIIVNPVLTKGLLNLE